MVTGAGAAELGEKIFRPLPLYVVSSACAISSGCSVGSSADELGKRIASCAYAGAAAPVLFAATFDELEALFDEAAGPAAVVGSGATRVGAEVPRNLGTCTIAISSTIAPSPIAAKSFGLLSAPTRRAIAIRPRSGRYPAPSLHCHSSSPADVRHRRRADMSSPSAAG